MSAVHLEREGVCIDCRGPSVRKGQKSNWPGNWEALGLDWKIWLVQRIQQSRWNLFLFPGPGFQYLLFFLIVTLYLYAFLFNLFCSALCFFVLPKMRLLQAPLFHNFFCVWLLINSQFLFQADENDPPWPTLSYSLEWCIYPWTNCHCQRGYIYSVQLIGTCKGWVEEKELHIHPHNESGVVFQMKEQQWFSRQKESLQVRGVCYKVSFVFPYLVQSTAERKALHRGQKFCPPHNEIDY